MSDEAKKQAALAAVKLVENGMRLGLGTGSTTAYFIDALAEKVKAGLDVVCVASSRASEQQAKSHVIPLADMSAIEKHQPKLDMMIDGADEIAPDLNLIKGGGGALLREKILATHSECVIIIADARKQVQQLGAFPLPIEVERFAHSATAMALADALPAGTPITLRRQNNGTTPFSTDGGHYIYDCAMGRIDDAPALAHHLSSVVGVIEHGLFINLADRAIIAGADGINIIDKTNVV